jgi:hypothetical protein
MGVSDEAKIVIPLKFLRKIKNIFFPLVNSIREHTVYVSHSLVSPEVYVEDMSQIRNRNGNSLSDHNLIYFYLPFLKPAVKIATKKHIRKMLYFALQAFRFLITKHKK